MSAIAHGISNAVSPPVVAMAAATLCARVATAPGAWLWAGCYVSLAVILPTLYIVIGVARGQLTDFHLQVRNERIRPLIFAFGTTLLAWGVLWQGGAPSQLRAVAGINSVQALLFY